MAKERQYSPTASWHFNNLAADSLGSFAMYTAFPCSDYYEPSVPFRHQQPTMDLPADQQAAGRVGQHRNGSHVHFAPVDRIDVQLCRCSLAKGTPQTFPLASPPTHTFGFGVVPPVTQQTRTAAQPISTRFEPVPHLSGFNHWFTFVTPLCLASQARTVW